MCKHFMNDLKMEVMKEKHIICICMYSVVFDIFSCVCAFFVGFLYFIIIYRDFKSHSLKKSKDKNEYYQTKMLFVSRKYVQNIT